MKSTCSKRLKSSVYLLDKACMTLLMDQNHAYQPLYHRAQYWWGGLVDFLIIERDMLFLFCIFIVLIWNIFFMFCIFIVCTRGSKYI